MPDPIDAADRRLRPERATPAPPRAATPTVEEMGESSFPASDPPPSWTWDPERPRGG
jgi:hypothetical protein